MRLAADFVLCMPCTSNTHGMRHALPAPVMLVNTDCMLAWLVRRTVTDMSVNFLGLMIALVSVVTSGLQQILCGTVQRKHNLTSVQLLSNTAPVQVGSEGLDRWGRLKFEMAQPARATGAPKAPHPAPQATPTQPCAHPRLPTHRRACCSC